MNLFFTSSQWISTLSLAIKRAMLAWHRRMIELRACPRISHVGLEPVRAVSKGFCMDKNKFTNYRQGFLSCASPTKAKTVKKIIVIETLTQLPSLISSPSFPTAGLVLLRISRKNIANRLVKTREGTSSTKILSKCTPPLSIGSGTATG